MALIPTQQGRQLFTQSFLGAWKETYPVTNFMRSWFETKTTPAKFVSIEVQRGTKKIAADIMRGTEANSNKFGLSTAKSFLPPYFAEKFTNEDLALYDQLFATQGDVVDSMMVAEAAREVTANYLELKNKIERAYEVQCAEVLQTGKVTTITNDVIDYKAKSTHIRTLSTKWDNSTPLIFDSLILAMEQLKTDGAASMEFDLIMGSLAAKKFLDSAEYKSGFGLTVSLTSQYNLPRADATSGAIFHNRISIGQFIVNIWTYNDTYTNRSDVDTAFLDPKKIVLMAKSFKGFLAFAAVPRVLTNNNIGSNPQFNAIIDMGAYTLNNFVKPEVSSHVFEIKSAGLAVPLTIDHFSCLTVLA